MNYYSVNPRRGSMVFSGNKTFSRNAGLTRLKIFQKIWGFFMCFNEIFKPSQDPEKENYINADLSVFHKEQNCKNPLCFGTFWTLKRSLHSLIFTNILRNLYFGIISPKFIFCRMISVGKRAEQSSLWLLKFI